MNVMIPDETITSPSKKLKDTTRSLPFLTLREGGSTISKQQAVKLDGKINS